MSKLLHHATKSAGKNFNSSSSASSSSSSSMIMNTCMYSRTSFSMTRCRSTLYSNRHGTTTTTTTTTTTSFSTFKNCAFSKNRVRLQEEHLKKQMQMLLSRQQSSNTSSTIRTASSDALTFELFGLQVKVPKGVFVLLV